MITQPGSRKEALLKKFVLQAHPILQTYIQKLKIAELIGTYIAQDHRLKLPVEQTLCVYPQTIVACANCSSEPTSSMWPIASWPPWKTFAGSTAAEAVSSV